MGAFVVVRNALSGEGIGDDEELVGHGDEGDFGGFALGEEAVSEGAAAGVGTGRGEGGHVQHVADLFTSADDVATTFAGAAVFGQGARPTRRLTALRSRVPSSGT